MATDRPTEIGIWGLTEPGLEDLAAHWWRVDPFAIGRCLWLREIPGGQQLFERVPRFQLRLRLFVGDAGLGRFVCVHRLAKRCGFVEFLSQAAGIDKLPQPERP